MKTVATPALPALKDEDKKKSAAVQLIEKADVLAIQNDQDQESAADLGQKMKAWADDAEKFFEPEIQQAYALHKGLCEKRKGIVQPVRDAIRRLGEKLGIYQDEQRRKAREKEEAALAASAAATDKAQDKLMKTAEKLEKEGDHESAEALVNAASETYVPPVPVPAPVKPAGVALRYTIEVQVLDAKKVPDQYKIVDVMMLKRAFTNSRETLDVPGVRFIKKPVAGFRG